MSGSQLEKKLPAPPPRKPPEGGSHQVISTPTRIPSQSSLCDAPAPPLVLQFHRFLSVADLAKGAIEAMLAIERQNFESKLAALEAKLLEHKIHVEGQLAILRKAIIDVQQGQMPTGIGDRTMRTLIGSVFAQRPAEKREIWCKIFEDQEILTVDAAARLGDKGWQQLNLPLGVVGKLQEAVGSLTEAPKLPSSPAPTSPAPFRSYTPSLSPIDAGPRIIPFVGQPDVVLTQTCVSTKSGCPHGSCGAEFDYSYDAQIGKYSPKCCSKCGRELRPPKRLIDSAKKYLGAKDTADDVATKIALVAAKSGLRIGAGYIPYVGTVVSEVGDAALDEAAKK